MARLFFLFFAFSAGFRLDAALPELSSIDPIEFDESAQRLIARGDARLDYGDTRLRADRITYYQEYSLADAPGNVSITHNGNRLIADRLNFDIENSVFSLDRLKTGQWPFYVSGVTAGGLTSEIKLEGATLYYGNPGPFTPTLTADSILFRDDQERSMEIRGAQLRLGSVPLLPIPNYTYRFGNSPYYLGLNAGYEDELGAYVETTALAPLGQSFRVGFNAHYYTNRGPLAGPAVQYIYDTDTQSITGALTSGFIDDQGDESELGVDRLGNAIRSSREFVEWRHKHNIGDRFSTTASISYWSDSEVTRDFARDQYDANQLPDSFLEAAYTGDNYVVSAFGRFGFNDFQLVQERVPEVRVDLLPLPIGQTGLYHRASASYARLAEDFDDFTQFRVGKTETDRIDLTYRLERPTMIKPWLSLTPLVGGRFTQYENQFQDRALPLPFSTIQDDSVDQSILELGFDLEMRAYRTFNTVNRTWEIEGLRHLMRPVLRYRYYSDPEELNATVAIDREVFDLERPILNLSDLRNVDQISQTHLIRLGVENLFQTRAAEYGSRTLASLNFYQDVLLDTETRYDGREENTFESTWLELVVSPAPWLKFEFAKRFETESLSLEELRTRTVIASGEIWQLGLSTDFVDSQIDQYRLDFMYRLNERYTVLHDLRFDADQGDFKAISIGLRSRVGNVWEVLYALTFRDDARRESDVAFNVKLRLIDPDF